MGYIAIAIAVFLLAIFAGCSGIKGNSTPKSSTSESSAVAEAKSSQRANIQRRLLKLAESKAPEFDGVWATCYEIADPPETVQYICPKCGEKTLYKRGEGEEDIGSFGVNRFVEYELKSCRRAVKAIRTLDIALDESQFCKKCSPDSKSPKLVLIIKYKGEETPHRCEYVTLDDLRLLREFLAGYRKHTGPYDNKTPLKDHLERLSELLGIEIELPEKETK
jgi:hypothetical protein